MVDVILVNYNGSVDTIDCLNSLEQIAPQINVIVIDNASEIGDYIALKRWLSQAQYKYKWQLHRLEDNLGFAGASNLGIQMFLKGQAQYVWLLNNDTLVFGDTLFELVKACEDDRRIGVAGSLITYADDPNRVWFAGGGINLWGWPYHIAQNAVIGTADIAPNKIRYITGCSMLITRKCVQDVGGLPEHYFMYFEDAHFCYVASKLGWGIAVVSSSIVLHKVSRTTVRTKGDPPAIMYYYQLRNQGLFNRVIDSGILGTLGLGLLLSLKLGRVLISTQTNKIAKLRSLVHGTISGLFGRTGSGVLVWNRDA